MKNTLIIPVLFVGFVLSPLVASAHRSGCHRWHSCPSDTGSYECGDLGYTSGCPSKDTPVIKETAPVVENKTKPAVEPKIKYIPVKDRKVEAAAASTAKNTSSVQKQKAAVKKLTAQAAKADTGTKSIQSIQPKTKEELSNCAIVGNKTSMIYFLKGNSLISKMNINNKYCFLNEDDAKSSGYRKSKVN